MVTLPARLITARILLSACVSLCFNLAAHADWPHIRGPNYDGTSTERGLADAWPAEGPPRLWSRELGQGYSGFIVADGKLFTQRQTIGGQYLLCLDPDTGDTIWEHRYDWAWRGAYPGPYASPTWHAGKVYFASTSSMVGCVDAKSGTPSWSVNLKERFGGKGFEFGYAATPLVEEDKVILPAGGPGAGLVALHVDDGRTVWAAGNDPASYCPALPITFAGKRCIVGYLQNSLILVESSSGKLLYRQALSAGYDEHSAWPIYREPHLALTAPFRAPAIRYELSLMQDAAITAKATWLSREMSNDVASSVLSGQHVYGFDLKDLQSRANRASRGKLKCIEWETGKACWSTDDVGHASLVIADGKLLLLADTGTLILARADPACYQELARTQLFEGEICWTPPMLWNGRLFVRSPSRAVCVLVGNANRPLPTMNAVAPTTPALRFDADRLLARERDFPNDAPTWQEMTLWFAACIVLVFGGAGLTALLCVLTAKHLLKRKLAGTFVFLPSALVLGALGPNVFSSWADVILFTWPACLYVAFHAAVLACGWAQSIDPPRRAASWLARLAVLVFLAIGYAYYEACKIVGMFVAWSFLVGFPFAFPFTVLAVRATLKDARVLAALWTLAAFTVFFWSAQVLLMWKAG